MVVLLLLLIIIFLLLMFSSSFSSFSSSFFSSSFFLFVVVAVGVGFHVGVRVLVMTEKQVFLWPTFPRCAFIASLGAWALNPGALKKRHGFDVAKTWPKKGKKSPPKMAKNDKN